MGAWLICQKNANIGCAQNEKIENVEASLESSSEENEQIDNIVMEAKFVAKKIKNMIDEGYLVCDKEKKYRKATYRDFAILLRSTKNVANIFEKK